MKNIFTIFFLFLSCISFSQTNTVAYTRDYEFTEGIFLNVNNFKQNSPIPKSAIVSGIPKTDIDFLKQVVEQKIIVYKDTSGKEQKLETANLWGFCQNRALSINFNKEFYRFNVIGTLCHFTAKVTTVVSYRDPMTFNNGMGMDRTVEELRQFVFDTQTNKIYDFDEKIMELLLKNDDLLYGQFTALKKRQKPDAIFVYLRKYNERHPLYLPGN